MTHVAVSLPEIRQSLEDRLEELAGSTGVSRVRRQSNRFVRFAIRTWQNGNAPLAAKGALRATQVDPTNARAFHVLASALQRMGYLHKALVTFEEALRLDPNDAEVVADLGLCAWKMKMGDTAQKLFRHYIASCPNSPLGYNNLGALQAEMGDLAGGVETLRDAISRMPEASILWHSLGNMMSEDGLVENSIPFYEEALRLDPTLPQYYHNLAYAWLHLGRMAKALDCIEKSTAGLRDPIDQAEAAYSRAICLIGMGRIAEGFDAYEARRNPLFRAYVPHMIKAPLWDGEPLEGKSLLVVAEQGLGDELMFASTIPDLERAVGPNGKLYIATDKRLTPLFRRSFPAAEAGSVVDRLLQDVDGNKPLRFTSFEFEAGTPDYFVPMGSALRHFRRTLDSFPHQAYLKPDPARVEHFRNLIAASGGKGPAVGLCWRSMMLQTKRAKYYSALEMWEPLLKTPGVRFINLQYDDCAAEIASVAEQFGVQIEIVEGLDLKNDIDGAAALSAALDLVVSAPTAAAAIAGSVGTPVWFLTACAAWPQLGTSEYPWYRKTRAFVPEKFGDWEQLLPDVAAELEKFAAGWH